MRFACLVVIMALVGLPAAARELQPGRDDAPADAGAAPTQHPSVGLPSPRAGAYVQLAAVPDFNTALILFAGISAAHPELVGDRPIILFRFDAGAERGLLYQLGIGPAGDDPAALAALCEGLKASGTDCGSVPCRPTRCRPAGARRRCGRGPRRRPRRGATGNISAATRKAPMPRWPASACWNSADRVPALTSGSRAA